MKYEAAIEWLYGTQLFGIKLGLENVRRLLGELGLFDALIGRKIIHVAGTNGKGSVCAFADAILRAAGKRTGLFTSPHLVTFRERIRVNGEMMPEAAVAETLTTIRDRIADWDPHPTFFEITLALAVRHFCERDCEVLVLETGMGGRLDATNVLDSDVAVITPIGLDHTQWLGETLAAIAGEKAGIIQPGNSVLSAPQSPEAAAVLEAEATRHASPLQWIDAEAARDFPLALDGSHQRFNAALAVAATRALFPDLDTETVARGLASVEWPARFQRLGNVVIDGAHNAHATRALVETWRNAFGESEKATLIFGGVNTKDTADVLRLLAPLAERWIFVKVASQRGLTVDDLEKAWKILDIGRDIPIERAANAAEALRLAEESPRILLTGSLYLAGEALAAIRGGAPFEVSNQ